MCIRDRAADQVRQVLMGATMPEKAPETPATAPAVKKSAPAAGGNGADKAPAAPPPSSLKRNEALIEAMVRPVDEMDLEQMGTIVLHTPLINAYLKAVNKRAQELLEKGTEVPHTKLVRGRGSKTWKDDDEKMMKRFSQWYRIDENGKSRNKLRQHEYTNRSPLSPAQAVKQIKPIVTPKVWENIEACVSYTPGKLTIAPETDPRPAVSITTSEEVFAEKTETPTEPDLSLLG